MRVLLTGLSSNAQIALQQRLQQLVPVQLANEGPGVVVVGDVGGVLAEDVAHQLVDGIVALLLQGGVDGTEDGVDLVVLVHIDAELAGIIDIIHWEHPR